MKHVFLLILVFFAFLASARTIVRTPKDDLKLVGWYYATGTNNIAQGRFREADSLLERGRRMATARLQELEGQTTDDNVQELIEGFRAVIADVERAQEELQVERAKPLDAERALGIAREYVAAAHRTIPGTRREFAGAESMINSAKAYLDDIRRTGAMENEIAETETSIIEVERLFNLAGVRYFLQEARGQLTREQPDFAKMAIDAGTRLYLSKLKGDSAFKELSEESDELMRAAEQMRADQKHAAEQEAIANARKELNDPEAPVLGDILLDPGEKTLGELRRFAAETDFAAILKQEFSEENLNLSVSRGHGSLIGFANDPDFIPTIRTAMMKTVNTNYPKSFPGGENFTIVLFPPQRSPYRPFYARIRKETDGRTIKEVVPYMRHLKVIRTSAQPDDVFLYFCGNTDALFESGGRTAMIPGLGAYLSTKLTKTWADKETEPIIFKGQ